MASSDIEFSSPVRPTWEKENVPMNDLDCLEMIKREDVDLSNYPRNELGD